MSSLQHLILSRNAIGEYEFDLNAPTSSSSSSPFATIEQLEISDCSLTSKFCQGLVREIIDSTMHHSYRNNTVMITGNRNLVLDLSHNERLGSNENGDSFASISTMNCLTTLVEETNLVELNLDDCSIHDEGLQVFIQSVTGSRLRKLNLSNNSIGPKSINCFAECLQERNENDNNDEGHILSALQELNLSNNQLDENSIMAFAQAVIANMGKVPLMKLDMTGTNCGVEGVINLLQISTLQELIAFNNQLGSDNGFSRISKHLNGGHPTLQTLDIGGNGASEEDCLILLQSLLNESSTTKNSLSLLVIGGNQKTGPKVEALCEEIKLVLPQLDIARDKPKKQQQSAMFQEEEPQIPFASIGNE